jgi:hypothetical protein
MTIEGGSCGKCKLAIPVQWHRAFGGCYLQPAGKPSTAAVGPVFFSRTGHSEMVLSTRLIVGKVGPGMWCGKCNSTPNVLVCETQRKMNTYGCVSE